MIFKFGTVLACAALTLAGCSASGPSATSTSAPTSPQPTQSASARDIVAAGTGITLGTGWYAYETYQGTSFRWVDNDAKFVVHAPASDKKRVAFEVEAGPGIGQPAFTLHLRDRDGNEIAQAQVVGHERVAFTLPVRPGSDAQFELHADGGGKSTPHENRTLNFRVFTVDDGPGATLGASDIVASPQVSLGKNWGVLEQYGGRTFRWVDNDAALSIVAPAAGKKELAVTVESGPSILSPADFAIALRDAAGHTLQSVHVPAAGIARFAVPLAAGRNAFVLHVDSTGKAAAATDKRVLDFRAFKISLS